MAPFEGGALGAAPFEGEFELPEFEFPEGGIEIPQRIHDGFTEQGETFINRLGGEEFIRLMRIPQ